ncbi:hypothetical protein V5735_03610 (plasmid) [Haladaptatus sp. SPP-AMP-3]|uniref:hypothetical protein n=1 Tax=Haladaptatus sp. SPP-AMP-3 TaxID=3121295 RepID=UPI003C2F38CE
MVEPLAEEGFCEIREQDFQSCPYCNIQIPVEELEPADGECHNCERTVFREKDSTESIQIVHLDETDVYNSLRKRFKQATGLPHGRKDSLNYREHEVEYRFLLKNKQGQVEYQSQVLFEPVPDTLIDCMRLYGYPILTILADSAVNKQQRFKEYDLPYRTLGEVVNADDDTIQDALENATQGTQLAHIDDRVRIADEWCTTRAHLELMDWYEFEHTVQAFLDKLFIQSRLLGGTAAGEEVPDGIMGFTIDEQSYRYFWDAKFVEFDTVEQHLLSTNPHVPMTSKESHSLSDQYRKISDHAHSYMADQGIDLDAVVLFSPRFSESQLPKVQRKLEQFKHRREWTGKTVYFTLDALIEIYHGFNQDRGNVSNKQGFFMRSIVDRLKDSSLHDDPETIANASGVIKFGIDDVHNIFDEVKTIPSEHEIPSYEVYVSRSRNT